MGELLSFYELVSEWLLFNAWWAFDSDAMNTLHFNGDELHLFLLKA
jgi:hypothetical protein